MLAAPSVSNRWRDWDRDLKCAPLGVRERFPSAFLISKSETSEAEARAYLKALRGAEAPLFHVTGRIC
jgi:hypothetical protein